MSIKVTQEFYHFFIRFAELNKIENVKCRQEQEDNLNLLITSMNVN
jgi:hypothetical protein